MQIHIHIHKHYHNDTLNSKLETIMSAQQQAADRLNQVATQLAKIQTEIQALKDAAAAETVSPELQAAIDRVAVAAQATDDMNEDSAEAPAE